MRSWRRACWFLSTSKSPCRNPAGSTPASRAARPHSDSEQHESSNDDEVRHLLAVSYARGHEGDKVLAVVAEEVVLGILGSERHAFTDHRLVVQTRADAPGTRRKEVDVLELRRRLL